MRHVRFTDPDGRVREGSWTGDTIAVDGEQFDPDAVSILPPVTPSKILGIGRNVRRPGTDVDEDPLVWLKGGPHVLSGHREPVRLDGGMTPIFEGELAVVIGERCKNVPAASAEEYVRGYTCANDITNLDALDEPSKLRVKSFDDALPLGPVLVDADEVPSDPRVRLWQNGTKKQDSADTEYVNTVSEVVSTFSQIMTLERNDVITMGTPSEGDPLTDGDDIRIEVEGVGRLEHSVSIDSEA